MVPLVEDLPDSRMLSDENSASDSSQEQGSKKRDLLYTRSSIDFAACTFARRIDASDFSTQEPEFRPVCTGRADDRIMSSHCGEHATSCWASTGLLVTQGVVVVMCGTEPAQMAAATPMRTRARKLEAHLFAVLKSCCPLRKGCRTMA
jgi:hypothetical protein